MAILLYLTSPSLAISAPAAGVIPHPKIQPDDYKLKAEAPAPQQDPKKLLEMMLIATAAKHCLAVESAITDQVKLIDAYNYQPDIDNLPKDMTDVEKEKAMVYMMGRPDIPDFGFLIPEAWRLAPRNLRIKFNAIVTLKLEEAISFKIGGYPFDGNCKGSLAGDITKDKNNFSHAKITTPLAFDVKETRLTYLLSKQEGYNWLINDLLIDDVGVGNYVKKDLANTVAEKGLAETIKDICKSSSLPTLRCNN